MYIVQVKSKQTFSLYIAPLALKRGRATGDRQAALEGVPLRQTWKQAMWQFCIQYILMKRSWFQKTMTNNHRPWYGLGVEQHEPGHRESDLRVKLNSRARWERSKDFSAKWVYLTVTAGESDFQTLFLSPQALQGQQSRWVAPVRRGTRE